MRNCGDASSLQTRVWSRLKAQYRHQQPYHHFHDAYAKVLAPHCVNANHAGTCAQPLRTHAQQANSMNLVVAYPVQHAAAGMGSSA